MQATTGTNSTVTRRIGIKNMDYLTEFFATQIDFRFNRKTKTYSILRLNHDPSMILYKDGVSRKTTEEEIQRQFKELIENN